ncbi:aspartate 1-decarboxylase [soil metagenome]
MRWVLSSKIHHATITEADVGYVGSITIDIALTERAGLWPGEKVLVVSNATGARLETYVIPGARNSRVVCMNGAAAHLIKKGEQVIVMGFELAEKPVLPRVVLVDADNRFLRYLDEHRATTEQDEVG